MNGRKVSVNKEIYLERFHFADKEHNFNQRMSVSYISDREVSYGRLLEAGMDKTEREAAEVLCISQNTIYYRKNKILKS